MGEAIAIEIKKRKLKEELSSENPDKQIVRRLKESIKRHKGISKHVKYRRIKNRRKNRGIN